MIIEKTDRRYKCHDKFKIVLKFKNDVLDFFASMELLEQLFGLSWNLDSRFLVDQIKERKWSYYLNKRMIVLQSDRVLTMFLMHKQ